MQTVARELIRSTDPKPKRRPGEGSVFYSAARGAYIVRMRERPGEPARTRYSPGPDTAENRQAAEDLRARWSVESRQDGKRSVGRRLTVGAWLDQWLELQTGLAPMTQRAYANRIELYLKPTIGHVKLAELEAIDVSRAMAKIRRMPGQRVAHVSAGTAEAAFKVLSAALQDGWRAGKISGNPARLVTVERVEREIEPPSLEELDRLFDALIVDEWRPIFSVLRWTGAREGEVLGLEWRRVDLDAGTIELVRQRTGKLKTRSSRRTVPIPASVVAELRRVPRRVGTDLVFSTRTGLPIDPRNLLKRFNAACERAGIAPHAGAEMSKYRVHDLRHAFATLMLEAGYAPHAVASTLGHGSLRMLDRYAHVKPVPNGEARRRFDAEFGIEHSAAIR